MKVCVDGDKCIGCSSCVSLTDGNVFEFNDDGKAYAKVEVVPEDQIENVQTAIEYCPTGAISEEK